jgi:hypothetical protein
MKHDIQIELNLVDETYRGTIDGLECYSSPDRLGIRFPGIGWRTLSWKSATARKTGGDVCKALVQLWGVKHPR